MNAARCLVSLLLCLSCPAIAAPSDFEIKVIHQNTPSQSIQYDRNCQDGEMSWVGYDIPEATWYAYVVVTKHPQPTVNGLYRVFKIKRTMQNGNLRLEFTAFCLRLPYHQ